MLLYNTIDIACLYFFTIESYITVAQKVWVWIFPFEIRQELCSAQILNKNC